MIDTTLKLKLQAEQRWQVSSQQQSPVAGLQPSYFVASENAYRWLEVALSACKDASCCDFFPIRIENRLMGVFIRVPSSEDTPGPMKGRDLQSYSTAGVLPMKSVDLPCSMSDNQLWIPCHSQISPMPLASQWPILISGQSDWMVWHPVFGLLLIDPLCRLGIESLMIAPAVVSSGWNRAVEGTAIPERLIRVDAPPPPTLEQWLDCSRIGIGDRTNSLVDLPPSQKESRGRPIENLVALARSTIGKSVAWLADRLDGFSKKRKADSSINQADPMRSFNTTRNDAAKPRAASSSQWVRAIREWATKQMEQWSETLEARRQASVNRLLEMLDQNPDEGLRYAIPMSDDPRRGLAPPGSELVARDLGWGNSASGGVDNWSLDWAAQKRLREKYLQLAQVEWTAGRYQRAATIYAQLLGDFLQAAQSLEKGKLYRPAALIYCERLHNRRKAAEMYCLAGDFDLSLDLYKKMGLHIEAGELYQRLGQLELATDEYWKHVKNLCNQDRPCDAADVLVDKLNQPDNAIELLKENWPHGPQAKTCAQKTFDLLAQLGRHEDSIQQIDRLVSNSGVVDVGVWPAEFLAGLVGSYPDKTVRQHAQHGLFINASQAVRSSSNMQCISAITNSLCRGVPEDKLLQRDAHFFVQQRRRDVEEQAKANTRATTAFPKIDKAKTLAPAKTISLTGGYDWFGMIPTQRGPLCFGEKEGTLLVRPSFASEASKKMDAQGIVEIRSFFRNEAAPRWLRYVGCNTLKGESFAVMVGGGQAKAEFGEGLAFWYDNALTFKIAAAGPHVHDFFYPANYLTSGWESERNESGSAVFLSSNLGQVRLCMLDALGHVSHASLHEWGGMTQFEQMIMHGARRLIKELGKNPEDFTEGEQAAWIAAEMLKRRWCIAKQDTQLLIGCGTQLQVFDSLKPAHAKEVLASIEWIRVSSPFTRPRALIGLKSGVMMQWLKADQYHSCMIDGAAQNSHSCFLRTGHIAIAHDTGIDLYSVNGFKINLVASHASNREYVGIAADQGFFWTFAKNGLVQKWDANPFAS